jgi:hypothetical protein
MTISSLFLVMINVWHLLWLVTQITVDTRDTAKMGMVCHRSSILATVPVPVKPVGHLPQVYPYPCYTLPIRCDTLQNAVIFVGLLWITLDASSGRFGPSDTWSTPPTCSYNTC